MVDPSGKKSSDLLLSDVPPVLRSRDQEFHEIQEAKERLEEEKNILQIKFNAKTKALQDLEQSMEQEIQNRTRELKEKVKDSENSRVALMNMLEDIEELRQREENEKEKTLAIITHLVDGLVFFDAFDRVSLVNPRLELFFNLGRGDAQKFAGRKFSDFIKIPALSPLADVLGAALKDISREEIIIDKNKAFEVSVSAVSGQRGKIGTILIIHDISREKMVEKMKTEFVSIAAHQLRTPISAIKWTLRMLLDGDLGAINEEQREFLDKTYKSNERMINLINDLLNVTRIEEGRYLYNMEIADVGNVVASLISGYEDIARRKNLKMIFEKSPVPPPVKVDLEKIKLVISNLIENALKYTPASGKISISVNEDNGGVAVRVRDTGIGIPSDQQDRIFTKYFRSPNAVKAETEGTGLGLFIAKNIVEGHGGQIGFSSEDGKGSSFYFTLPPASPKE